MTVLEQDGEWWKGAFGGDEGLFPSNIVELAAAVDAAPEEPAPEPSPGPASEPAPQPVPELAPAAATVEAVAASTPLPPPASIAPAPATTAVEAAVGVDVPYLKEAVMGPQAKQKKLVFGMNPLWGHASFIDLFADAFIPKNFGTEKAVSGFGNLLKSLDFVNRSLMKLWPKTGGVGGPGPVIVDAFQDMLTTCAMLPVNAGKDAAFLQFLEMFMMKVAALPPGGLMIAPTGWSTGEGGHVMLLLLGRGRVDPTKYTFAVVNTGEGLEYHAARADPSTSAIKRNLSFLLQDVSGQRLHQRRQ